MVQTQSRKCRIDAPLFKYVFVKTSALDSFVSVTVCKCVVSVCALCHFTRLLPCVLVCLVVCVFVCSSAGSFFICLPSRSFVCLFVCSLAYWPVWLFCSCVWRGFAPFRRFDASPCADMLMFRRFDMPMFRRSHASTLRRFNVCCVLLFDCFCCFDIS